MEIFLSSSACTLSASHSLIECVPAPDYIDDNPVDFRALSHAQEAKETQTCGIANKEAINVNAQQSVVSNLNKAARSTERLDCKVTSLRKLCEHNRHRNSYKECGGASICEHNRRRSQCKESGGSSICEHNRQRSSCKECGGASICEHNRMRKSCKECGGAVLLSVNTNTTAEEVIARNAEHKFDLVF